MLAIESEVKRALEKWHRELLKPLRDGEDFPQSYIKVRPYILDYIAYLSEIKEFARGELLNYVSNEIGWWEAIEKDTQQQIDSSSHCEPAYSESPWLDFLAEQLRETYEKRGVLDVVDSIGREAISAFLKSKYVIAREKFQNARSQYEQLGEIGKYGVEIVDSWLAKIPAMI